MLISPGYRQIQSDLHASNPNYGTACKAYAPLISKFMNARKVTELLDYGAGKLGLMKAISEGRMVEHKFSYSAYEPSNPKYADTPEPAEMVACIDVLEHIEPDLIDNVLDDIKRCTKAYAFISVSCVPAFKTLPDGRNAHLIIEGPEWWLPKLMARMELHSFQKSPDDGFFVLMAPYEE